MLEIVSRSSAKGEEVWALAHILGACLQGNFTFWSHYEKGVEALLRADEESIK